MKYAICYPIRHNGKRIAEGPIELDPEQALSLLACGAIAVMSVSAEERAQAAAEAEAVAQAAADAEAAAQAAEAAKAEKAEAKRKKAAAKA